MTCVVGIRTGAKVLVAGDSIATNRSTSDVRVDPKVFADGPLAFGHTTSFRWGQIAQFYTLPALASGNDAPSTDDDLYEWAVTRFVPRLRADLSEHGWLKKEQEREEGGRAILAVADRLFTVHSDFQIAEVVDHYTAVGSGAEVALGTLFARIGVERTRPPQARQAEAAAELAIMAAAYHSAYVRPPILTVWTGPPAPRLHVVE